MAVLLIELLAISVKIVFHSQNLHVAERIEINSEIEGIDFTQSTLRAIL